MKKSLLTLTLLKALALISSSILAIGISSCSNMEYSNAITLQEFDIEMEKIAKEVEERGEYKNFGAIKSDEIARRRGFLRECVDKCPELWEKISPKSIEQLLFNDYDKCLRVISEEMIRVTSDYKPSLYEVQEIFSPIFTPKLIYTNDCPSNFFEYGLMSREKCMEDINSILNMLGFYYMRLDIRYFLGLDEIAFSNGKNLPILYMNDDRRAIVLTVDLFNSEDEFDLCRESISVKEDDSCFLKNTWDIKENSKHCWRGKQKSIAPLSWSYINLLLHSRLPGQKVEPWRENLFQEIEKNGLLNSIGVLAVSLLGDKKKWNLCVPNNHELSNNFALMLLKHIESQSENRK